MTDINFTPVCTVTADGQEMYHDGSRCYLESIQRFENRRNADYVHRMEQERMTQEMFVPVAPKPKKKPEKKAPAPRGKWETGHLRRQRMAQGMTNKQLAEAEGVSVKTIENWRYRNAL